jgi:hypothetical protein
MLPTPTNQPCLSAERATSERAAPLLAKVGLVGWGKVLSNQPLPEYPKLENYICSPLPIRDLCKLEGCFGNSLPKMDKK